MTMPEGEVKRKSENCRNTSKLGERHNRAREKGSAGVINGGMKEELAPSGEVHAGVIDVNMDGMNMSKVWD